ncbi:lipoyl synthase [candidate division WOR-3 bacterium]|nr:lipoyl synthase [candidate division WOR-3 bacterium]
MSVPEWIRHRSVAEALERKQHFPKDVGAYRNTPLYEMKSLLHGLALHTICEEAKCPNIGECFAKKTATFLILGDVCTRNCGFCGVKKGKPKPVDPEEPENVAKAVKQLKLKHAVITSVTRDDLQDKGAGQFIKVVKEIQKLKPTTTIELLIPFLELQWLKEVIDTQPEVINHNIETVPRLYPEVRPGFNYQNTLELLSQIKLFNSSIISKSSIMLGLGETKNEVIQAMKDLRTQEVDILTIGQYLRPSGKQLPVVNYIHPKKFLEYQETGYSLGFKYVISGPYVRSSYKAQEALLEVQNAN